MKQKKSAMSVICVLTAGVLWGCMGILVRRMTKSGFTSLEITAFRAFVTTILMVLGMLLINRKALRIRLRDVWCFLGTGIVSVTFFNVCYFSCMNETSLSVAAILLYTAPSFVMVLSAVLFKERLTLRKICALVMAFAGCILVSGGFTGGALGTKGLLLGLGAGLGYALYSIFSRYALQRGYSTFTVTTYTFLFATVGMLPILDVRHMTDCILADSSQLPFEIVLVILTTVAAYLLYTKGLAGMENSKAAILATIEPVTAAVVGLLVFAEPVSPAGLVGMVLVLGSCVLG